MRRAKIATRLASVAAVAAVSLASASPAFAGKPSGGGGGGKPKPGGGTGTATVSVVPIDSTDGLVHWNQRITFNVTSTNPQPYVRLRCYQGGSLVAEGTEGFFSGTLDDGIFRLWSGAWSSASAADCTGDVVTSAGSVMGTTNFHVYA